MYTLWELQFVNILVFIVDSFVLTSDTNYIDMF